MDARIADPAESTDALYRYCRAVDRHAYELLPLIYHPDAAEVHGAYRGVASEHAAHHPGSPLRSLTVMATPVDFKHVGPLGDVFATSGLDVDSVLDENGNIPAQVVQRGFRMLTPTADAAKYAALWEKLWSDEYVTAYQAMAQWVGDHIPFPGAAGRETVDMLVRDNAMMTDRLRVGDDDVHLKDIRLPFLTVLANRDHVVTPEAAAPLIDLVGSTDKQQLRLDAGHIGLVVGRTASRTTIPQVIDFLARHNDPVS